MSAAIELTYLVDFGSYKILVSINTVRNKYSITDKKGTFEFKRKI